VSVGPVAKRASPGVSTAGHGRGAGTIAGYTIGSSNCTQLRLGHDGEFRCHDRVSSAWRACCDPWGAGIFARRAIRLRKNKRRPDCTIRRKANSDAIHQYLHLRFRTGAGYRRRLCIVFCERPSIANRPTATLTLKRARGPLPGPYMIGTTVPRHR
jgi:hypothetical protein